MRVNLQLELECIGRNQTFVIAGLAAADLDLLNRWYTAIAIKQFVELFGYCHVLLPRATLNITDQADLGTNTHASLLQSKLTGLILPVGTFRKVDLIIRARHCGVLT